MRLATAANRGSVAAMLARAFQDDPAFGYIFPDPVERARRLPRLFALLYDSDGRAGMRLVSDGGEAATLWRGPGRAHVGWGEMLRHALPLLHALGPNLRRALAVSAAIDAHMPAGDFWYLHIAGCDPAAQGRGLGRKALTAGLERVAGRLPCYLETATERNLGFYASAGFAVTGEWRIGRDGPRMWSMLRPPG
ncbi:GNAT family N-acetyltransferase [Sphingomonas sp. RP10(2022)]|uniref:GNAT family N-acetyltransferase n=1 Tax=Sphingomonas liriopis TaxID=2949094 RepID=A0A9X2KT42_9SPHN|nr:GNAT family N-acetyltransferase [Sphingomonas liriopis]MCP3734503.1 GNAT family N-acetyltransferase [Sphingomonas liriopis]